MLLDKLTELIEDYEDIEAVHTLLKKKLKSRPIEDFWQELGV